MPMITIASVEPIVHPVANTHEQEIVSRSEICYSLMANHVTRTSSALLETFNFMHSQSSRHALTLTR